MPSSTISCQISVSVNEYTVRYCLVTLGTASDVNCFLPSNKNSNFSSIIINLLDDITSERMCITHSYVFDAVQCICPAPLSYDSNDINCYISVYAESHLDLCYVNIRSLFYDEKICIVPVYEYDQINCLAIGKLNTDHSIICYVPIATESLFNMINLDVQFKSSDYIICSVTGELYNDIKCEIVTNTKVDDVQCILNESVDIDAYSEIQSIIYRQAGEPVDYVAVEVVLGERKISTTKCVVEIPAHNYYDLMCSTSYVVSGSPRWNRFMTSESLIVRLMDLGDIKVSKAVLQSLTVTEEAKEISQINNIWQVKFDRQNDLNNYVIVITLSNEKVLVVDRSKSYFSL